jgi:transcription initiation factor IIE alpha subunit
MKKKLMLQKKKIIHKLKEDEKIKKEVCFLRCFVNELAFASSCL